MDSSPADIAATSRVHLPIEGESSFILIMRALAAAMICVLTTVALIFLLFPDGKAGPMESAAMVGGLALLLALEYGAVLHILVRRRADYGRYRIQDHKVYYFPLTWLGLGVSNVGQEMPISAFEGVSVSAETRAFTVSLVHPQQGKTILIRPFQTNTEAQAYAHTLAETLHINVIRRQAA